MKKHLLSPIHAREGDRYYEPLQSFVIDGMTVSGVSPQVGDRFRAIGSVQLVDPDIARDHIVNAVNRGIGELAEVIRQIQAETRRLTALLKKQGAEAAKAGDVNTLRGLAAEIGDALRLHAEPKSVGRTKIIETALDDKRSAYFYDREPIDKAIASLAKCQDDFDQAVAGLRGLQVEVDRQIVEATSPATLRRLAEAGREVAARAVMARVADEIAQIDQAFRAAMRRLESLKQMAEAVR
ncbi:MAG: hypothetical protein ACRC67_12035 [Inquilinus sp.]|uniref:hypothetical protein n=1 Tax=Inquilinus sp. TaxID=1932117 RepID=UPI003F38941F